MTECSKKGFWIFKETVHDWNDWVTTDRGYEDQSRMTSAWRQYWIKQERTCKICGQVEMRTESHSAMRS